MFLELLDGNHLVLYDDMQERPDLYDETMRLLVDELAGGARRFDSLTDKEKQLLDVATLEYATKPPVPSHERRREATFKRATAKLAAEPGLGIKTGAEEQMPAFWWLR